MKQLIESIKSDSTKLLQNVKAGAVEVKERWKAETPPFWKKVQKIAFYVIGIGGTIAALPVILPTAPAWIAGIGAFVSASGASFATAAKLTKM